MQKLKSFFDRPFITIILLLSMFISSQSLFSKNTAKKDYSKGPLAAKSMFVPFMIFLSFPGERAKAGRQFDFKYHVGVYYTNDFFIPYYSNTFKLVPLRVSDYESLNTQVSFYFNPLKNLTIGTTFWLISYYGGFLDPVVEGFHQFLYYLTKNNLNAGREFFPKGEVLINQENDNNLNLYLNKPAFSFGDIDLDLKYTFFENSKISLAGEFGFKIPTGRLSTLSGSGYPDIGFAILADFMPWYFMSFYVQASVILPMNILFSNSKPFPMFQSILAMEINPHKIFSLIFQFLIKTPVFAGEEVYKKYILPENYRYPHQSSPQVDFIVGLKFQIKTFVITIFFTENPVYEAGTDLTAGISITHTLNPKKVLF